MKKKMNRYLYAYQGNTPSRNIGFVKVEQTEERGTMVIYARGLGLPQPSALQVYIAFPTADGYWGVSVGTIERTEPELQERLEYTVEDLPEGVSADQVDGLVLISGSRRMGALWGDGRWKIQDMKPYEDRRVVTGRDVPEQDREEQLDADMATQPSVDFPERERLGAEFDSRFSEGQSKAEGSASNFAGNLRRERGRQHPETEEGPGRDSQMQPGANPPTGGRSVQQPGADFPGDERGEFSSDMAEEQGVKGELSSDSAEEQEVRGEFSSDLAEEQKGRGEFSPDFAENQRETRELDSYPVGDQRIRGECRTDSAGDENGEGEPSPAPVESQAAAAEDYIEYSPYHYEKIRREQLAHLPRQEWYLANNSFLLHGYRNYHHLMHIQQEEHHWIGVPGIYHEKEAQVARRFGFPDFHRPQGHVDTEREFDMEDFGYWCRQVGGFSL